MKIMLIDRVVSGHHIPYIQSFIEYGAKENKYITLLPIHTEKCANNYLLPEKKNVRNEFYRILQYYQWMRRIKRIVHEEKPDVIHFIYGDSLYRYFGLGLRTLFRGRCGVVTFHQIRKSVIRNRSYSIISKKANCIIVHSNSLKDELTNIGINRIEVIDYPKFSLHYQTNQEMARTQLGMKVPQNEKVLLALGGTRRDKGLDILLRALSDVKEPFYLLIAGKLEDVSEEEIARLSESYQERVYLIPRFLTDEEFNLCIIASDIVVLPYRRSFDGASGPLGEAVWYYKEIVGSGHGSLKELIESNELGETFVSEDKESLSKVLRKMLIRQFVPGRKYTEFRERMNPELFVKRNEKVYSHYRSKSETFN